MFSKDPILYYTYTYILSIIRKSNFEIYASSYNLKFTAFLVDTFNIFVLQMAV